MSKSLICHFLIGCPGSGKSTFAALLAKAGGYKIVSTDKIRETLYGDESIQGDWSVIEAQVLAQIREAIALNQSVIYDATNAQRAWRTTLLMQLATENIQWVAWHLQTSLETCKAWNQKRKRRVPDSVIEQMFKSLQDFPPVLAEGFIAVNVVKNTSQGFIVLEHFPQFLPLMKMGSRS